MRRVLPMLALLSLAFVSAPAERSDPNKVDLKRMQGKWFRVECATRPVGDPLTVEIEQGDFELVITGDVATATYRKEKRGTYRVTLDARKTPKAIDFKEGERVHAGIYTLNADVLTICTQMVPLGERPTDIATARDGHRREVYKRTKR